MSKKKKKSLAKRVISGVLFICVGLLLFLGVFGKAGSGGEAFYKIFKQLFGWEVFLIPLLFIIIGVLILRAVRWQWFKFLGIFLFAVSVLGLLDISFRQISAGGMIGAWITGALERTFDFWGSLVILSGLFLVSLFTTFSLPYKVLSVGQKISLPKRGKKEEEEEGEFEEEEKTLKDKPIFKRRPIFQLSKSSKEKKTKKQKKKEDKAVSKKKPAFSESDYIPPLKVLRSPTKQGRLVSRGEIKKNRATIKDTLDNFGISVTMGEVNAGPTVTQYTFEPARGVKLSKIEALQKDLSLALAVHPLRIEAPIPGKSLVGLEVPNKRRKEVRLRQMLESNKFKKRKSSLTMPLGLDVSGNFVFADLEAMPHLLIAGATGSGKSVCIHNILASYLYQNTPETLRFILVDPKRVELNSYDGIPHLLTPVIGKPKKAINALKWVIAEMERRYDFLSEVKCRNIESLNKRLGKSEALRSYAQEEGLLQSGENIPYIIVIIDELADIMSQFGREMETVVVRLAQMARAVGIHLILSTQRPSVEVITGLIKANITARVAFQVASQVDSRTILDGKGAEKLLGDGDMLFMPGDSQELIRIQGVFVSEKEVKKIVKHLKKQPPLDSFRQEEERLEDEHKSLSARIKNFKEKELEDELYPDARKLVLKARKGSASLLQRKLRIGYARAARLLDMMAEEGIVGPTRGSKARKVLVAKDEVDL